MFRDRRFVGKTVKKSEEMFTKKHQDRFSVFYLWARVSSDWERVTREDSRVLAVFQFLSSCWLQGVGCKLLLVISHCTLHLYFVHVFVCV